MAIKNADGERITPVQAAKLLVVYGGVMAQDYPDGLLEGGEDTILQATLTEKEAREIERHIWPQIDRVMAFLKIEHLWC